MIQRIQNIVLHLAMFPIALIVAAVYAFIAAIGLTAVAALIIGLAEWMSY